jgi:hypothetical protein
MKIEIKDGIDPVVALKLVTEVVEMGKISEGEHGKMYYCWWTSFNVNGEEIHVQCRQYRKSDCFLVRK